MANNLERMNALFGDLRGNLSARPERLDSAMILHLSREAYALGPSAWESRWRGYLMHASRSFPAPLFTISGKDWQAKLDEATYLLPGAFFALDLDGMRGGEEHVRALTESASMSSVVWLDLTDNGLEPPDIEAIAASPYLTNLERLALGNNRVSTGARALANSDTLSSPP